MKTAIKTPIRSSDELWLWAEEKRRLSPASKYTTPKVSSRHSSPMAQGILSRLYTLLRDSCLSVR